MVNMSETHPCACGCNAPVPARSFYKPGHDARHASQVGHDVADVLLHDRNAKRRDKKVRDLFATLPTDRLVSRANSIAETAIQRHSKAS